MKPSNQRIAKQYIKKMRTRYPELSVNWGTICTPLDVVARDGKKRGKPYVRLNKNKKYCDELKCQK